MTKISVIGLGAAGLPLAACFGEKYEVVGVDLDPSRVKEINKKVYSDGFESGLEDLLKKTNLKATTDYKSIIGADLVFVCVPSDSNDFTAVEKSLETLNGFYKGDVVISSTVAPGITRRMQEKYPNLRLAHVPIRTFEGLAVEQFRVFPHIIGCFDEAAYKKISAVFEACGCEALRAIPAEKAELAKLFSNNYRQTEIAIANELAHISDLYGIDHHEILNLVRHKDPHRNIKQPGIWGGYCLPKDTKMLIEAVKSAHGYIPRILSATEEVRWDTIRKKARQLLAKGKIIGIEGIANKPLEHKSSDVRGSPVLHLIDILIKNGAKVIVHDPHVKKDAMGELALEHGFVAGDAEAVKKCDVYARFEDYDIKIKSLKP